MHYYSKTYRWGAILLMSVRLVGRWMAFKFKSDRCRWMQMRDAVETRPDAVPRRRVRFVIGM